MIRFCSALLFGVVAMVPVSDAVAQCPFDRVAKAGKMSVSLVQAFEQCNGRRCSGGDGDGFVCSVDADCPGGTCTLHASNTSTDAGLPACSPPTMFLPNGDSPARWRWDPLKSSGTVQMKSGKNKAEFDPSYADPTSRDLFVSAKLSGIVDGLGDPANGFGSVIVTVRWTTPDPVAGDVTTIDYPVGFPIQVTNGKGSMSRSINDLIAHHVLYAVGRPISGCATSQIVAISVSDSTGATFAVPGLQ